MPPTSTTTTKLTAVPARAAGAGWTFAITSAALFMTALDNLVVTMALPNIREHLHATLGGLEWTVSAYTLTFAALLLTGSALGERFGRRRMFVAGLTVFTLGSALAALAPDITVLVLARAAQGLGGAVVTPLTLTLLARAVSPERRALALGAWGAIGGLAVAVGPLVGGAIVQGASWQWIFWLNVPIGVVLVPVAFARLDESRGRPGRLDLGGLVLASAGLFGVVFALVRSTSVSWGSAEVFGPLVGGVALIGAFALYERRAATPMLPLELFRSRGFTAANLASLFMSFGMFGSIFLLAQFLQIVQHYSPLDAGIRTLPWTAMPMFVAPVAGLVTQRLGGRPVLATGLALQAAGLAWLACVISPTAAYIELVPAFLLNGVGMALFFAPMASTVLSSVGPTMEGVASGVNNAIRELGGVLGIAVLASVFSDRGGYSSAHDFVSGLVPAVFVGAAIVALAVAAALAIPRRPRALATELVPAGEAAGLRAELETVA
jgi:EmrB/QacA subfamily drug resistance transporter